MLEKDYEEREKVDPGEAAVALGVYFIVLLLNILYLGGEDEAIPYGCFHCSCLIQSPNTLFCVACILASWR